MSIKILITCDCCGAERKEQNHWFLAHCLTALENVSGQLRIDTFNLEMAQEFNYDILCGEACVQQWISLNIGRIVPKAPKEQHNES